MLASCRIVSLLLRLHNLIQHSRTLLETNPTMTDNSKLGRLIAEGARTTDSYTVIQPLTFAQSGQTNEFLLFSKPELLLPENPQHPQHAFELILSKLDEYKVAVSGIVAMSGTVLERQDIM